jgi:Holliday junction resolvase RusA-like endonuclease
VIASFVIDGIPVGKGRPRFGRVGKHVRVFTPEKTKRFETIVAEVAAAAIGPIDPYAGAVEVEAHFSLPVPKSWSKRRRAAALAGDELPTGKPDIDNFFKALADGMNGVVYVDDSQITDTRVRKRYGEEPGVAVTVRPA